MTNKDSNNKDQVDIKEKGYIGERLFAKWLNKKDIPYIYVRQEPKTDEQEDSHWPENFSAFLKKTGAKRPDFIVFLAGIGIFAVDVKNKEITEYNSAESVTLSESELIRAQRFSEITRLNLWYAYAGKHDNDHCDKWYFIHNNDVQRKGNLDKSNIFFNIKLEETFCANDDNTIGDLVMYAKESTIDRLKYEQLTKKETTHD